MSGRPRAQAAERRQDFLGGPAVAALFRAARRESPGRDKLPQRNFAVPQGAPHPDEVKP